MLLLDEVVPDRVAEALELAVAFMLILLGADVLRRLLRDRVHFHGHRHGDVLHMHAHSHSHGTDHKQGLVFPCPVPTFNLSAPKPLIAD